MSPKKRVISIFLVLVLLVTAPFSIKADEYKFFVKITYTDYTTEIYNQQNNTYTVRATKNVYITGNFDAYFGSVLVGQNLTSYEYHEGVSIVGVQSTYTWNGTSGAYSTYSVNGLTLVASDPESNINVEVDNLKWNFPIESFPFTAAIMQNQTLTEWSQDLNYYYPTFECASGSRIFNATVNPTNEKANEYIFVLGVDANVYNESTFNACFNITSDSNNHKLEYVETLFRNNFGHISIIKGKITSTNNQTANCYINAAKNLKIMSIYGNYSYYQNLSADFAALYNLSNHQATVDNLDESNNNLDNKITDFNTMEDTFNNNLNDSLNAINITSNTNIINSPNFSTSASWVAQQFTRMTNNNIIGDLILYALVFGLAIMIIGKLR